MDAGMPYILAKWWDASSTCICTDVVDFFFFFFASEALYWKVEVRYCSWHCLLMFYLLPVLFVQRFSANMFIKMKNTQISVYTWQNYKEWCTLRYKTLDRMIR